MKNLITTIVTILAVVGLCNQAAAQNVAGVRSGLATGASKVNITEQSDVAQTVRVVEQRRGKTKVSGYTILILSDNSETARENANKAKESFEENFPETKVKMYYDSPSFYVTAGSYLTKEEAIIELWRFRSVFPKAITQSREMDIEEFIIRPDEEGDEESDKQGAKPATK